MTYTVWHRGRLLGESPLDFIRCMPNLRTGFLHPTPLGENLLPLAGGTCAAANALHRAARRCSLEQRTRLPEYAAFLEAMRTSASFHLEVRGPDGIGIPTSDVGVRDYGFIDELGEDAFVEELEGELGDEFESETLASLGLDDWDGTWDPSVDQEDARRDFDEDAAHEPWRAREERVCERRSSRYQVMVYLIDESSIP